MPYLSAPVSDCTPRRPPLEDRVVALCGLSAVSAIQFDEERIRAERVGQISHQEAADSRWVLRSAAGQAIEADGTGEAEALLCGDEFESSPRQLGQVGRRRPVTLMGIKQSHEAAPDQPPGAPVRAASPTRARQRGCPRSGTDGDRPDRAGLARPARPQRQFAQAGIRRVAIEDRADGRGIGLPGRRSLSGRSRRSRA